jgi:hypothetical protein
MTVLTDAQVIGLIEDSVVLLRDISARLSVTPMADKKYDSKTIELAITFLQREVPDSSRFIDGLTRKKQVVVTSTQTDDQINTHIGVVFANLRNVINRLRPTPLADKSYHLTNIKKACDTLEVKKLVDLPTVVIDELTSDCQLRNNFPNPPVVQNGQQVYIA